MRPAPTGVSSSNNTRSSALTSTGLGCSFQFGLSHLTVSGIPKNRTRFAKEQVMEEIQVLS